MECNKFTNKVVRFTSKVQEQAEGSLYEYLENEIVTVLFEQLADFLYTCCEYEKPDYYESYYLIIDYLYDLTLEKDFTGLELPRKHLNKFNKLFKIAMSVYDFNCVLYNRKFKNYFDYYNIKHSAVAPSVRFTSSIGTARYFMTKIEFSVDINSDLFTDMIDSVCTMRRNDLNLSEIAGVESSNNLLSILYNSLQKC